MENHRRVTGPPEESLLEDIEENQSQESPGGVDGKVESKIQRLFQHLAVFRPLQR